VRVNSHAALVREATARDIDERRKENVQVGDPVIGCRGFHRWRWAQASLGAGDLPGASHSNKPSST
jgi:hypothetical protein